MRVLPSFFNFFQFKGYILVQKKWTGRNWSQVYYKHMIFFTLSTVKVHVKVCSCVFFLLGMVVFA
jgi:hypothetical protein